ncbi:formate dehydrogenase subunit gamma, partial [Shewanella xiamenensis]|nr:formate dehydrogenase subunit gamma [Shewanella xiamenensis]
MKRLITVITSLTAGIYSLPLLASETLMPQPQQWQPIQEIAVQGDIPELRGMPLQPEFPAPLAQVNQGYLETLAPATWWADLLT